MERDFRMLVDGELVGGVTTFDVINPATGSSFAHCPKADRALIDRAVAAAKRAFPAWSATPIEQRAALVDKLADALEARAGEFASLLTSEQGKPLDQAMFEMMGSIFTLRAFAAMRVEPKTLREEGGNTVIEHRTPLGVVAAITPWNFPVILLMNKLGPALVTGNTVVAKPSEISPLSTLAFFQLVHDEMTLPPGVVNLVTGAGPTGQALVDDPLSSLVSFTGHRDTGKAVMARASAHLTRVSLELGGKAPAIVWKDADLDLTVKAILAARHTNCGQVCTSAERVLVHRDVLKPFTERYVEAARGLRVGDPFEGADLGPMVSVKQYEKTTAAVALARKEGATVLTGGGRPEGSAYKSGYWFAPTVLGDVSPAMSVMIEETFGPVTPILGIDSIEEAVDIANASRYGLSAYLFSRDYGTVMRTVNDLDFGEIYINRTLGESIHAHHTGYKESGIGGEDGKWGLLRYTQLKTAYHHYGTE